MSWGDSPQGRWYYKNHAFNKARSAEKNRLRRADPEKYSRILEQNRRSRLRNHTPERQRRYMLKTRYGLTEERVAQMLESQGGKCGVCWQPMEKYEVDHDHETGRVRGLLHHDCNVQVGYYESSNIELIRRYVMRHKYGSSR